MIRRKRLFPDFVWQKKRQLLTLSVKEGLWSKINSSVAIIILLANLVFIYQNQQGVVESRRSLDEAIAQRKVSENALALMARQVSADEQMATTAKLQKDIAIVPRMEVLPKWPKVEGHRDSISKYTVFRLSLRNSGAISLASVRVKTYCYFCQKPFNLSAFQDSALMIHQSSNVSSGFVKILASSSGLEVYPIDDGTEVGSFEAMDVGEVRRFNLDIRNNYENSRALQKVVRPRMAHFTFLRLRVTADRAADRQEFVVVDRYYLAAFGAGNERSPYLTSALIPRDPSDQSAIEQYSISVGEVKKAVERMEQ